MIYTKECGHCGAEYTYEGFANLISFCPICKKYDFLECEYGYGPVVPCIVYLGREVIGMITYDYTNELRYRYDSDYFSIHKVLDKKYLEALEEVRDLTQYLL